MNDSQNTTENNEIPIDSAAPEQTDSPTASPSEDSSSEQKKGAPPAQETIISRVREAFRSPILTNILLAGLFSNNIYLFYNDYETTHRFSSLLMMIQVCCVALFFLIRIAPTKVSMKPMDWSMAIIGTCLPFLISPVDSANEIAILMLLQFFGIFISIVAILSLNNSFAVVPALRKIKTSGLYSLVRHPMYLGYFLTFTCVALQNLSLLNIIVIATLYAADIYRIRAEEKVLSIDPGYVLYKARVRYRLIPFLW